MKLTVAGAAGRRRSGDWGGVSLDPTNVLFVSLFLMLFGFFAVLNANSTEKSDESEAVMDSLHSSFGQVGAAQDGDLLWMQARSALETAFPKTRATNTPDGKGAQAALALDSFFINSTTTLAPSRELALKSFAEVVSGKAMVDYKVAVGFSRSAPQVSTQRKVAAIAAALGKYGLSSDQLSVTGSRLADTPGEAGQVYLILNQGEAW